MNKITYKWNAKLVHNHQFGQRAQFEAINRTSTPHETQELAQTEQPAWGEPHHTLARKRRRVAVTIGGRRRRTFYNCNHRKGRRWWLRFAVNSVCDWEENVDFLVKKKNIILILKKLDFSLNLTQTSKKIKKYGFFLFFKRLDFP